MSVLDQGIGEGKGARRGPTWNLVGRGEEGGGGKGERREVGGHGHGQGRDESGTGTGTGRNENDADRQEHDHEEGDSKRSSEKAARAPTYAEPDAGPLRQPKNAAKPKGKDLKDPGDIRGDEANASFQDADAIGTEDDPARLAEEKFERRTADGGSGSGSGPRKAVGGGGDGGQFDVLDGETDA